MSDSINNEEHQLGRALLQVLPSEKEDKLQLAISAELILETVLVWKNILKSARADQRWTLVQE